MSECDICVVVYGSLFCQVPSSGNELNTEFDRGLVLTSPALHLLRFCPFLDGLL